MFKRIATTAIIAASLTAQPAVAAYFNATYVGTMTSGYDSSGYFGSIGSLAGNAVTAEYLFNFDAGDVFHDSPNVIGFAGYGISKVTISIGGKSIVLSGDNAGGVTKLTEGGASDLINHWVFQPDFTFPGQSGVFDQSDAGIELNGGDFLTAADLTQSITIGSEKGVGTGHFTLIKDLCGCDPFQLRGTFDITSATISAVPEPATWAMMFIGVTGVGGALRLRRKREALAPALA